MDAVDDAVMKVWVSTVFEAVYGSRCAQLRRTSAPPTSREVCLGLAASDGRLAQVRVLGAGDVVPGYAEACALADRLSAGLSSNSQTPIRVVPWSAVEQASVVSCWEAVGPLGSVVLAADIDWLVAAEIAPPSSGVAGVLEVVLPAGLLAEGGTLRAPGSMDARLVVDGYSVVGTLRLGATRAVFTPRTRGVGPSGPRARFSCALDEATCEGWSLVVDDEGVVALAEGVHALRWVTQGDSFGLFAGPREATGVRGAILEPTVTAARERGDDGAGTIAVEPGMIEEELGAERWAGGATAGDYDDEVTVALRRPTMGSRSTGNE